MIDPPTWEEALPQLPTTFFNGLPLDGLIKRVERRNFEYFQQNAATT